nr:MAG TPA: alpha-2-macroglobulin [Caudoviricetes sp.]
MTSINQIEGGDVLKSGDTTSVFGFEILGYDGKRMNLSGTGKLTLSNDESVALYQDATVESGRFTFTMGDIVDPGTYYLEIKLDGHIFPSNNFKVKVKNSLNADSAIPSDKGPKLKLLADELRESGLITGGSETTEDLVNVYNLAKI